jgi:D-alanine-D-alanine ligase
MDKKRVLILMGGKSAEHEVSLQSAKNVISALDRNKFEPVIVGISKVGEWFFMDGPDYLDNPNDPKNISLKSNGKPLFVVPGSDDPLTIKESNDRIGQIDAAFPVLHGPYGEDGTMQGFLQIVGIPFVGAGVMGSAVGMDKEAMKRLFRDAGVPSADFFVFYDHKKDEIDYNKITEKLGLPLFIKPCNLGSSVGVSRVTNEEEFKKAIEEAFSHDSKIIVEENIKGRELECSVLGNKELSASVPGEVITNTEKHGFYSYEAKYLDEHGAQLKIPAQLPEETVKKIQEVSIKAYRALFCEGMGRVDSFLMENGKIMVNEINTLPGFTAISMYPKLWEATGKTYKDLITELIELAIERGA